MSVFGVVCVLGTWTTPLTGKETSVDWEEARQFWAFRRPVAVAPPEVTNERWVRNDIDRFILARLAQAGVDPAPEAARETIIRRVSFDLIGLPPTHDEIDRFLIDTSRDPMEVLVFRLLRSPRFGERWASMWMNVARYADENPGSRVIRPRARPLSEAWRYRRWVIEAFNRDLPYDQFVRLQLAADLLGETDHAALGFLALGPQTGPAAGLNIRDRGQEQLRILADGHADQVDTVTRGLLGLSVACARCHDHFYDPITSEDYYALAGVFANTARTVGGPAEEPVHTVMDAAADDLRLFTGAGSVPEGAPVPRRFLRVLSPGDTRTFVDGSGRRELAEAIASPDNPLTARVMVNRVWGELFGRALVATPSEFGHGGESPSHPDLLDYLAVRFMENGWSIRWLVGEMVQSATYRQQCSAGQGHDGVLLAGMKRRRLTAEMLRDAMLKVSGELEKGGGPSHPLSDPGHLRRTIYGTVSRVELDSFLRQFGYPDPGTHAPMRETTTTPGQKLFLLNSPFVNARARKLAADLEGQDPGQGLDTLYFRLFSRLPTRTEREIAVKFFAGSDRPTGKRWAKFAQVLLSSNPFIYRE